MSIRFGLLIAACGLLLASCAGDIKPAPTAPRVVIKEIDKFVPLDPALLQDCPIVEPTSAKVYEAVYVANQRKLSLQKCNADKAAIRAAQPAEAGFTGNIP